MKYCGVPGGEAFRGSYYLRGKAFFPAKKSRLDHKFFTRMKYLLDYHPGLLKYPEKDFLDEVYEMVEDNLEDVKEFPVGTQIDYLLRVFQTCFVGLKYKNPLYLPFATNQMTRSFMVFLHVTNEAAGSQRHAPRFCFLNWLLSKLRMEFPRSGKQC